MQNKTRYQCPYPPDTLPDGIPYVGKMRQKRSHVERHTEPPVRPAPRRRLRHGVVALVLVGVLVALGCIIIWQQAVIPAFQGLQDQWHYGDSHLTQMDANVGHGGVSHFLAEYYQGAIVVVEIPEKNFKNANIYTLTNMIGASSDTVILLSTEPGKIPGKPDLLIQVQGSSISIVLYNTGTAFQRSEGQ
jgi:hypothetical protein